MRSCNGCYFNVSALEKPYFGTKKGSIVEVGL